MRFQEEEPIYRPTCQRSGHVVAKAHLQAQGFRLSPGTIVDSTLIAAPSSTRNAQGARDPQMKQSRKGKQWYFGMKAHVAMDARTKLIHRVVATSGAVHDSKALPQLLHCKELVVWEMRLTAAKAR
jgi:IS5 family transposase